MPLCLWQAVLREWAFSAASFGAPRWLRARKMGTTDMQAVMASGFAGGIGLSGGACGALGAAIWILAMKNTRGGMVDFNSPEVTDTIDRFVESSEVRFECSEIVGRKFQDTGDHAGYLRAGGCS